MKRIWAMVAVVLAVCVGGVLAARYETLTITELQVDTIKELNKGDGITVSDLVDYSSNTQKVDVINESTAGTGVTIEGVLHKDGYLSFTNSASIVPNASGTLALREAAIEIADQAGTGGGVLSAVAGQSITLESVTFDGGAIGSIVSGTFTNSAIIDCADADTLRIKEAAIQITDAAGTGDGTINAVSGRDIVIESVTFDGGEIGSIVTGTFTNGATIVCTDADTLTITENTVAISGALTATSFGGISSANLLDKSASETVSGAYTFGALVSDTYTNGATIVPTGADVLTITETTVDIDGASTASSYASDAGITAVTEVTIDGKYSAVGPDASTGLMVDYGTGTISANGSVTQAFTVAFASAPAVTFSYTESPGTYTNWVDNIGTNSFQAHGVASKTFNFIAVGPRP